MGIADGKGTQLLRLAFDHLDDLTKMKKTVGTRRGEVWGGGSSRRNLGDEVLEPQIRAVQEGRADQWAKDPER